MVLVSYPKSVIQGVSCELETLSLATLGEAVGTAKKRTSGPLEFVSLYCQCRIQVTRRLGGGQNTQGSCPGNSLGPVASIEITGKLRPICVSKALTLEILLLLEFDYVH